MAKHNATGRSNSERGAIKVAGRNPRSPPDDVAWIFHTVELRTSDAWKSRSITLVKLLDFLEMEHMLHAGNENGRLLATYDQLVRFGLSRRLIKQAIAEGEAKGLIKARRAKVRGQILNSCTAFTLTYKSARTSIDGREWDAQPTDEWRKYQSSRSDTIPSSLCGTV